jgi:hypothetical protein
VKRIDKSDIVCLVASGILLTMTILSIVETDRSGYQIWTGIFSASICLIPMLFRHGGVMKLPFALVVLIEAAIFLHGYGVLLMTYDDLVWYDSVTHTISSITVTLCIFYSLMTVELFDRHTSFSPKWIPMFIILIALTFGIYWEVFELAADTVWGINMQYSPWDTVRDMACNLLGALIVTLSAWYYLQRHTCEEFITSMELHPLIKKAISYHRPADVEKLASNKNKKPIDR